MSADGKQGWRIDEGHVNWWNWRVGKKSAGAAATATNTFLEHFDDLWFPGADDVFVSDSRRQFVLFLDPKEHIAVWCRPFAAATSSRRELLAEADEGPLTDRDV